MTRFLFPLILVGLGITIFALIEAIRANPGRVRILPKGAWIAVIILVPPVGGILWLIFGKSWSSRNTSGQSKFTTPHPLSSPGPFTGRGSGNRSARGSGKTPRPTSPDDDAEFLRRLDIQRAQKAREAELNAREEQLRAREKRLRQQSENTEGQDDENNDTA